jgi:outer membrane protein assembly factor BamB
MVVNVRGFAAPVFPTWSEVSAKYDADGNGQLSREEVRGNATYYEQFSYADVDRGGTITALEWTQMRDVGVGNFGLIALRRGGADGAPTVLWRVEKNLPYVPAPVLYRGVVYMVKNGGIVTAVDADSGRILKEARAGDALGQYFASPVAGDGKVYMASAEGKIAVIEAGPELRVLRVNDVADEIFGTPALVDGAVLVRTRSRLHSFRHQ